jgi:two-component system, OmpR family, sensor histidine kinase BaeS
LFVTGALVAGFVATLALNVANPDALIARTNLDRPHIDTAYLGGLSDDAIPVLLKRLPTLEPAVRIPLAQALLRRSDRSEGFVGWNASRSRARELLRQQRGDLLKLATGRLP